MQNKDKIIKEVAVELGIPATKVLEVVMSQLDLARKTMQGREKRSVYIRKVGTFVGPAVKTELFDKIKQTRQIKKLNAVNKQEEDPLEF
jgi:uncharacterized protein YdiU (UPF0061 family)